MLDEERTPVTRRGRRRSAEVSGDPYGDSRSWVGNRPPDELAAGVVFGADRGPADPTSVGRDPSSDTVAAASGAPDLITESYHFEWPARVDDGPRRGRRRAPEQPATPHPRSRRPAGAPARSPGPAGALDRSGRHRAAPEHEDTIGFAAGELTGRGRGTGSAGGHGADPARPDDLWVHRGRSAHRTYGPGHVAGGTGYDEPGPHVDGDAGYDEPGPYVDGDAGYGEPERDVDGNAGHDEPGPHVDGGAGRGAERDPDRRSARDPGQPPGDRDTGSGPAGSRAVRDTGRRR